MSLNMSNKISRIKKETLKMNGSFNCQGIKKAVHTMAQMAHKQHHSSWSQRKNTIDFEMPTLYNKFTAFMNLAARCKHSDNHVPGTQPTSCNKVTLRQLLGTAHTDLARDARSRQQKAAERTTPSIKREYASENIA
jgi:hypothetical protein